MSKSKKENVEAKPQLEVEVEDEFEAEEGVVEDIHIIDEDPKLKSSSTKQVYESRRKLEDLLAEKRRKKEQNYDFEDKND